MEKQEILEKSRRENQKGDERERTIRMEGESFSLLFVFLMGLILLTWKRVHGLPHEDVLTMFWTACVANRVSRLARRRNTSDIVTLLISLAFLKKDARKFPGIFFDSLLTSLLGIWYALLVKKTW